MKLYRLTEEFESLRAMLEGDEDVPLEVIADTLEAVSGEIDEKADHIACILKGMQVDIDALDREEKALAARKKKLKGKHDWLKDMLSRELQKIGRDKVETARCRISFRASEKCELVVTDKEFIEWAQGIHDEYLTKVSPKVNKDAIKAALKDGIDVPGAVILKCQNIQIK